MLSGILFFLSLAVALAAAQDAATFQAIINDLGGFGLTGMVTLMSSFADATFNTTITSSAPKTLFVPSNAAFSSATIGNPTGLLLYLLATGGLFTSDVIGTGANDSILSTALTGNALSFLENNKTAVIACGIPNNDGVIEIYNQNSPTHVNATHTNSQLNIAYNVIDRVIDFPENYPLAIGSLAPTWHSIAQSAGMSDSAVGSLQGFTFFAFTDAGYQQDLNAHLAHESSLDILNNHVIIGKTIWSNLFDNQTYTTASGNELSFTWRSDGLGFNVTIGQSTAFISRPDVVTDNGVIHIINSTLFDLHPSNTSSPTSTTSASANSLSGSFPKGAIIGLSLGLSIAAFIVALLAFLFFQRKRKKTLKLDLDEDDGIVYPRPYSVELSGVTYPASAYADSEPSSTTTRPYPGEKIHRNQPSSTSVFSPENPPPLPIRALSPPPPSESGATTYEHQQISDAVVEHILERVAARIDSNRGSEDAPPEYNGYRRPSTHRQTSAETSMSNMAGSSSYLLGSR